MFGKIVIYLLYIITVSFLHNIVDGCQSCNQILATLHLKPSLLSDFETQDSLSYRISNRIYNSLDDGPFQTVELLSIEQDIDSTMQVYSEELQSNAIDSQTDDIQDLYSQTEYSDNLMNAVSSINALELGVTESQLIDLWLTDNLGITESLENSINVNLDSLDTIITTLFAQQIPSSESSITATATTNSSSVVTTTYHYSDDRSHSQITSFPSIYESIHSYEYMLMTSEAITEVLLVTTSSKLAIQSWIHSQNFIPESLISKEFISKSIYNSVQTMQTSGSISTNVDHSINSEADVITFTRLSPGHTSLSNQVESVDLMYSHGSDLLQDVTSLLLSSKVHTDIIGVSSYEQSTPVVEVLAANVSSLNTVDVDFTLTSLSEMSMRSIFNPKTTTYQETNSVTHITSYSYLIYSTCTTKCSPLDLTTPVSSNVVDYIVPSTSYASVSAVSDYIAICYPFCTTDQTLQLDVNPSSTSADDIKPTVLLQNTTASPFYPIVLHDIGILNVTKGVAFSYKLPNNSFYDINDGFTPNLKVQLKNNNGDVIPSYSWIQFNANTQSLYGLPLQTSIGSHRYKLIITNSRNDKLVYPIIINVSTVYRNASAKDHFRFILTIDKPFNEFTNVRQKINLISKIASYFGDTNVNYMTTLSFANGSTIVTWTNSTIGLNRCNSDLFKTLTSKLFDIDGNPTQNFKTAMLPEYPILSILSQRPQSCNLNPNSSSATLIAILVPVCLVVVVVVIIILVVIVMRKKYKTKEPDIELHDVYLSRKPMVLIKELEPPTPLVSSGDVDFKNIPVKDNLVKHIVDIPEKHCHDKEIDHKDGSLSSSSGSSLSLDSLGTTSFCPREQEKELESIYSDLNKSLDMSSPDSCYYSFLHKSTSLSCSLDQSKSYDDEFCLDSPTLASGCSTDRDAEMFAYKI